MKKTMLVMAIACALVTTAIVADQHSRRNRAKEDTLLGALTTIALHLATIAKPDEVARCPDGFDHYTSDYSLGCQGGGSCWRLKSAGHSPAGVDGAGYSWPGYLVQCEQGYPQLAARQSPSTDELDPGAGSEDTPAGTPQEPVSSLVE